MIYSHTDDGVGRQDASEEILDRLIDHFELNWSTEARESIKSNLVQFGLGDDLKALVELVRVDIDFRYKRDIQAEIKDYTDRFPQLVEHPSELLSIAYEDYRSRKAADYATPASRYGSLDGVEEADWFRELLLTDDGGDSSFVEKKLAEEGFHVIEEIGDGRFSRVYLAKQSALSDRLVVLKVVNVPLSEPQNMAMLTHTNIVPIYSFHEVDSCCAICMPYFGRLTLERFMKVDNDDSSISRSRTGESLVETVRDQMANVSTVRSAPVSDKPNEIALPEPHVHEADEHAPLEQLQELDCSALAIWIFSRLSSALVHSHARGILHGDLKPANVLIGNDGEPALMDFNLSQKVGCVPDFVGGTIRYMPPETLLAMHDPTLLETSDVALDERSDVYSIGVMMFEFLTGRHPFPVPTDVDETDAYSIRSLRRNKPLWNDDDKVPSGVRGIVDKCLAFESSHRFPDAISLQRDLERERDGQPLVLAKESVGSRLKKWIRRHPNLTSVTFVGFACVALMIPILWATMSLFSRHQRLTAQVEFQSFHNASVAFLTGSLADPDRAEESKIIKGLGLLDDFEIRKEGEARFVVPTLDQDRKQEIRDTILRQVGQVAFLEVERLRPIAAAGSLADTDLNRLENLAKTAEKVSTKPSRSLLFIKSNLARLAGDKKQAEQIRSTALKTVADSDSEKYLEAIRLISRHQHKRAQAFLTALADRNSIPPELRWTGLGRAQLANGQYEDAKVSFTQSLERVPNSSKLHVLRGISFMKLRQGDRATEDFSRAIELDRENLKALANRGLVHLGRNRLHLAVNDFSRILQIQPNHVFALLKRSQAYKKLGEVQKSESDFGLALKSGSDANSFVQRSIAREKDDPSGAIADLLHANQLDPNNPVILMSIARLHSLRMGDHQAAIKFYTQALSLNNENETALIDRALALARVQQYDRSLSDLDAATKHTNTARTHYQAACVCALMPRKHHVRGLSHLASAIRAGYEAERLMSDPDLESLRRMPGFQAIVRSYQLSKLRRKRS